MENITIPLEVSPEIMVALNQSEQELKEQFQVAIAVMLFKDKKLTIGQSIHLSGLSRYEFEKVLAKNNIPVSLTSLEEVLGDLEKLKDL